MLVNSLRVALELLNYSYIYIYLLRVKAGCHWLFRSLLSPVFNRFY